MKRTILLSLLLALFMTKVIAYTEVPGFDGPTWYDYKEEITNGSGSENNPYLIESPGQLAQLAYEVNNGSSKIDQYYKLAKDIDLLEFMNNKRVLWVPIGLDRDHSFEGTLMNPDGHTIKGMMIKANSIATTQTFGLFGLLRGTVEDIHLGGTDEYTSEIQISCSGEYYAGLLCGEMLGYIRRCKVEGMIKADEVDDIVRIGGVVGYCYAYYINDNKKGGELLSCVAKTTIEINGDKTSSNKYRVYAGGVAGQAVGPVADCHAIINMRVSDFLSKPTETREWSYLGGVIGLFASNVSSAKLSLKYCSAAGDITVDKASKTRTGGTVGGLDDKSFRMDYCTTTVTLTGGHTLGGLMGYCYVWTELNSYSGGISGVMLTSNISNNYIDARDAQYAGGLFGEIKTTEGKFFNMADGVSYNYTIGTMAKPTDSNAHYGTIFGHANYNSEETLPFARFVYSPQMCDLQTNGIGRTLTNVGQYSGHIPNDDGFGSFGIHWSYNNGQIGSSYPEKIAKSFDDIDMCYTDIYKIADMLFYITNDRRILYRATDVTVDFSIDDIKNSTTGERLCTFSVPDNVKCVRVEEKHLYPLDPGEVVVSVKWNGLERKVHLDITYGKEWTGGRNETPDGGDGTADDPYVIHNSDQFYSFVNRSKTNKERVYLKLANDIFFNTHLIQENGTPREGANSNWIVKDFYANLDGNGKTIYGLYVDATTTEADKSYGLFANLYGSVSNLAIVDSYVQVNAENTGINVGLLCGKMMEGSSVSNCLLHGTVSSNATRGGLCGVVEKGTSSITDLFVCAYVTWPGFPAKVGTAYDAAGVAYDSPPSDIMERCFSISRVDEYTFTEGITDTDYIIDCYYDAQMLQHPSVVREFGLTTQRILSQQLFAGKDKWVQEEERYPMLKTFADSPYGKLLATPVIFDCSNVDDYYSADWAGKVNNIFEFPTEDATWSALHGQTYLDVINDCGAASIVSETGDGVEILIAQSNDETSQCTRAMRTLPLNIRSGLTTFKFKDPVAKAAAEAAFDKNGDKILTLRELVEASQNDFAVFNASAKENEDDLIAFPEFRYFTETTILSEGMLSGLDKLSELQLPKKLITIDENAFSGCTSLEEITLPATFTTMKKGALYESGIKNILVNPKHKTMQSIDGALYDTDNIGKLHLVVYPQGRGEADATISAPLHYIDDYAFYKIPSLRNIYIDNCLPEGNLVETDVPGKPIIHEKDGEMMDIYVNDGSYGSSLFNEYKNDLYWGDYADENHLHIYYPLTITDAKWATLYIGFTTQLPEGLKAYVVPTDINTTIAEGSNEILLKSIGRVIPATSSILTPVVIYAEEPGLYPLLRYTGSVPDIAMYENKLIGSYIGQKENGKQLWGVPVYQEDADEGSVLTLGRNADNEVGFFKYNGKEVPPYRAYLGYTNIIEQNANACFMFFIDDIPQGITTGQALPFNDSVSETWYTLEGVQLNGKPTKKGIYIINGKKRILK